MIPIAAPVLGAAERESVTAALSDGRLAAGREVEAFETAFAEHCGVARAVATTNGTTALHAGLRALGIGEGDRVVTTPFSFVATANAIRLCGATPVFADIDPETYNLDPDALEAVVAADPDAVDAVLAVHLYGLPADVSEIRAVCDRYDLALVEDAAQAHGARYEGEPVGSLGDVACFSFYPTKNMTTGEGGMITTDRDDVADAAARFVDHGRAEDGYTHATVGHNFRMTNLAAAVGLPQLERLPSFVEARRRNAALLDERLEPTSVETPTEPAGRRHAYHQYTVRHPRRDALADALEDAGVGSAVYYPRPIHRQPAYADVDHDAPAAERAAEEVLSLPVHPGLSTAEVERVAEATARAVREVVA